MDNLIKLPTEDKPEVSLLLKGETGTVITINANGIALASTHEGAVFTWCYIGNRLELVTYIDKMRVDLSLSFDDVDEINTNG